MRARFARTLRMHMRDAEMYSHPGTHVWSADDALIADLLLDTLRIDTHLADDDVTTVMADRCPALDQDDVLRVWNRLQTFPYVFEVAQARGNVDDLHLDGRRKERTLDTRRATLSSVQYRGWNVALKDSTALHTEDRLSPALLEHLAQCFREEAP